MHSRFPCGLRSSISLNPSQPLHQFWLFTLNSILFSGNTRSRFWRIFSKKIKRQKPGNRNPFGWMQWKWALIKNINWENFIFCINLTFTVEKRVGSMENFPKPSFPFTVSWPTTLFFLSFESARPTIFTVTFLIRRATAKRLFTSNHQDGCFRKHLLKRSRPWNGIRFPNAV